MSWTVLHTVREALIAYAEYQNVAFQKMEGIQDTALGLADVMQHLW